MTSLSTIAAGWFTFAKQPEELKGVIKARLDTCDSCDDKTQMNDLAQVVVSIINEKGSTYKCGQCGCPLASSTASMPYACVAGKWRAVSDVEEQLIMSDPVTYTALYENTINTAFVDTRNIDEPSS